MSASEALTIWMLSTAMNAPSVEPITAIQVRAVTGPATAVMVASLPGRLGVDGRLDRHARPQQTFELLVVQRDLHRNALHDLGKVAGGVVGRQQREFQAACR